MALMRSRRGDFLAELQKVAVDVADSELSHAIVEAFDGIDDAGLVAKLGPQRIDIVDMKIKGASEKGLLEGNMFVREREHDFRGVALKRRPPFEAAGAAKSEDVAIETNGLLNVCDVKDGDGAFERHGRLRDAAAFA
jgi:hypothetical protein